jgi:hypothetical protein
MRCVQSALMRIVMVEKKVKEYALGRDFRGIYGPSGITRLNSSLKEEQHDTFQVCTLAMAIILTFPV